MPCIAVRTVNVSYELRRQKLEAFVQFALGNYFRYMQSARYIIADISEMLCEIISAFQCQSDMRCALSQFELLNLLITSRAKITRQKNNMKQSLNRY